MLGCGPMGTATERTDSRRTGTVIWITGLAGAGKSTLAALVVERLRRAGRPTVLLDGDELRRSVFPDVGFSAAERLGLARRYAALAGLLARQGADVVCATISMFPEIWQENRARLPEYREVLVRAPAAVRRARKPEVYDAAGAPVVGDSLPAPEPPEPHAVLENDGSRTPDELVDELWEALG